MTKKTEFHSRSVEAAAKLDNVRQVLKRGDLPAASKLSCIYSLANRHLALTPPLSANDVSRRTI